ncbi:MAG: alkaline phosphatase family protein [Deltaproteobacteria bacterium]|jgi:predicted AlkP superfamily phosphohydrolase/phosphomutase|nr:alkaline phosphatase family protein [Deltaproteobacteria bacterium]
MPLTKNARARRAALVGFDCAVPKRLEALMAQGELPNFRKFKEGGAYFTEGFNLPTVTPPSWATVATGAWPRTHGVEDYYYYVEGRPLPHRETVQAFGSRILTAETIWDRWDRAGLKSVVVNYPMSWPSSMRNGVMVMGEGISPAERRHMERGNAHREYLAAEGMLSTETFGQGTRVEFKRAKGWTGLPPGREHAEFAAEVNFRESAAGLEPVVWHGLAWASGGGGYDRFALAPSKDFGEAFFTVSKGEWSGPVELDFELLAVPGGREDTGDCGDAARREGVGGPEAASVPGDGGGGPEAGGRKARRPPGEKGVFRAKLMEMSEDLDVFTLYVSGISGRSGFVDPPEAAASIDFSRVITANDIGLVSYLCGAIDRETVSELAAFHSEWLLNAAESLLEATPDWDLFYMHSHPIDWFYHGFMSDMESPDPVIRREAYALELAVYRIEDRLLGRLMELFGEDTAVCVCSDHGATPAGPIFNTAEALAAKGLCSYVKKPSTSYWDVYEESEGYGYRLELEKSRAVPQKYMFVYVNLEGRYPGGIVKGEDYERTRAEIIDALLDYRHPETGERPVLLAVRKEDARVFGMGGSQAGDVVYALKPEYMAEHGYGLPTGESGIGSLKNVLCFRGPGIKKGFVYERPRWLCDIVPTLCQATGNPVPRDCEGAVIYQLFEGFD